MWYSCTVVSVVHLYSDLGDIVEQMKMVGAMILVYGNALEIRAFTNTSNTVFFLFC